MRLCRYEYGGKRETGFYFDDGIAGLRRLVQEFVSPASGTLNSAAVGDDLLAFLPPGGEHFAAASELFKQYQRLPGADQARLKTPLEEVRLLVPVARPAKVVLLAGNYAEHVKEGGGQAVERAETYPYFFVKPPTTTLTNPGDPIRIPEISPHHVDWEIELGVVIGRRCRGVSEADALKYVAGYTICNDVSDRKLRINPDRKQREKDRYFDWLHGKWHDTFLPMGPCILAASAASDPQNFALKLRVNGETMQDASTAQMIFPVAALVSTLSGFVTLEPGDIISTGTPSGVGFARKPPIFLKSGDRVEAEIGGIGILRNPVV